MPYIGQPLNAGNLAVQTGTGDGSDTTPIAALNYSVGSSESLAIYLDGVKQAVSTYTASGTTLTFTTAPPNGVGIEVVFLALSISLPTPGDGTVDETKLKDALVADFTEVVVTASDSILLGDATDSGNTKRDTVQGILDLAAVSAQFMALAIYDVSTATGTVDHTGAGFDPTAAIILFALDNDGKASWGMGTNTVDGSIYSISNGVAGDYQQTSALGVAYHSSGNIATASLSMITDGIRLSWVKTGSPTGTVELKILMFK